MLAVELLDQISKSIINTYSNDSLDPKKVDVALFLAYLENALKYRDSSQIDPFLNEVLGKGGSQHSDSLSEDIYSLFRAVYICSQQELPGEQSNELIAEIFPIFAHSLQYLYKQEVSNFRDRMNTEQAALEKLDKSKSDFISIAAHELKTPLTLLEGYTAMMREIIQQRQIFDEHLFSLMDGMNSGSRRLREIINDMIDVSLIDNELLSLNFQPTWVYKLLEKIKMEFQEVVESRRMAMRLNRFDGDDIVNYYDGERIFQALSNVVSNAIKYTPDEGEIIIDGKKVEDYYELMVIDNGIGVDPMNQSKIFSKFDPIGDTLLHSSGKTKFKGGGPGLGLPIAKGIIEAHGGRIWVESEGYDELACPGSTFHILLPILTQPPDQAADILFNPQFIHRSSSEI